LCASKIQKIKIIERRLKGGWYMDKNLIDEILRDIGLEHLDYLDDSQDRDQE
jgi:hypothetical protein